MILSLIIKNTDCLPVTTHDFGIAFLISGLGCAYLCFVFWLADYYDNLCILISGLILPVLLLGALLI